MFLKKLTTGLDKSKQTYLIINLIFLLTIILIFAYSAVFKPDNHPIPALLTEATGIISPSKGLSASFSEMARGNLNEALSHNIYGLRVFSFFATQLLLRVFFTISLFLLPYKTLHIVLTDVTLSIALFIWSFAPLISYTLRMLTSIQHLS